MKAKALWLVLVAQFCSAFADNALLFAAIMMVKHEAFPIWSIPLLQSFFTGAYILLAPFVGAIADAYPKGRVMLLANGLKLAGGISMALGLNPFIAYGLVGAGAAAYSPAKYGILPEILPLERLVRGNGWLEASTIVAILLGAVVGGFLSDKDLNLAFAVVTAFYVTAAIINFFIPRLPPAQPSTLKPLVLLKRFIVDVKVLWRDRAARLSLIGTSAFWGAGATLRFMLVAWVPVALGIMGNEMPSKLNGVVAIGVVIGAAVAGKFITLTASTRVLPAGGLIGVAIIAFAMSGNVWTAIVFCTVVGALGGFFVVPLNALLQERGHESVGSGSAIAVQNLMENVAMFVLIAAWTGLSASGTPVVSAAIVFGSVFGLFMFWFWRSNRAVKIQDGPPDRN
ncbi:MAG TPA: lysophospholipid transporter LplT [Burkholderiales bacterium]|nr:lysophospholipid transporter LplT [Burkholderiales bacterium]